MTAYWQRRVAERRPDECLYCPRGNAAALPGRKICQRHRERYTATAKSRRHRRGADECVSCPVGNRRARPGYRTCEVHAVDSNGRWFYRAADECPRCPPGNHSSIQGQILCEVHEQYNRLHCARVQARKRLGGTCISCSRKAIPGAGRCRMHRKLNRDRSKRYAATHDRKDAQRARRDRWSDQGLCPNCVPHRPLAHGRKMCAPCLSRRNDRTPERVAQEAAEVAAHRLRRYQELGIVSKSLTGVAGRGT